MCMHRYICVVSIEVITTITQHFYLIRQYHRLYKNILRTLSLKTNLSPIFRPSITFYIHNKKKEGKKKTPKDRPSSAQRPGPFVSSPAPTPNPHPGMGPARPGRAYSPCLASRTSSPSGSSPTPPSPSPAGPRSPSPSCQSGPYPPRSAWTGGSGTLAGAATPSETRSRSRKYCTYGAVI